MPEKKRKYRQESKQAGTPRPSAKKAAKNQTKKNGRAVQSAAGKLKQAANLPFDKYDYYQRSVQSADLDVKFFRKTYRQIRDEEPLILREDFCGTFQLCCEWVKLGEEYQAVGYDIDPEPLAYGRENNLAKLKPLQRERLQLCRNSVLDGPLQAADVSVAVNFSFMLFKERTVMRQYLKNCFEALRPSGIHVLDVFGGSEAMAPIEEETEYEDDNYSYFWDQESYNPVNGHAMFYIHFKRKGEAKREKVFTYDWRLWSIPELRELLEEAGFRKTTVYWEGTDKKTNSGNGIFRPTEVGEACEGWIAYIVAEK